VGTAYLHRHDIDPAHLDPAPPWAPLRRTGAQRLRSKRSCHVCGQPATATGVVDTSLGLRWLDRCTPCLVAGYDRG
jgi:hypothetical protein